jgi:hypothetical protein
MADYAALPRCLRAAARVVCATARVCGFALWAKEAIDQKGTAAEPADNAASRI